MFKVKGELLQALHDYLMTKPMSEVEHLVMQLRALEEEKNQEQAP